MRIGHGFDVHAFGEGDHVILGGVHIPFEYGIVAHSDGDVLIHALCDALLGALCLGDIGHLFPPSDPRWKGADSRIFLRHITQLMAERRYQISNVDVTVICEKPKLAPYTNHIKKHLADDLGTSIEQINIKATTTENLGFIGRGEGIAATAVVLLFSIANQN
jgi:2-C-methyl-D-erythritol 2,4-cyclodiphosphate synthase